MSAQSRYAQIIEHIFLSRYEEGDRAVPFERQDIVRAAEELDIPRPKNLGDVVYSFRHHRRALPEAVRARAPEDETWIIRQAGSGRYSFETTLIARIEPDEQLTDTKIPDSTPGVIAKYALSDEQALLAKLRYNRLIDIFTGVACYSLQSHLRTAVPEIGQVETDEIYIGVDQHGAHYVFPVQAKGGSDTLSTVQIEQDFALCEDKFPSLICRPIAAQFMGKDLIALFGLEQTEERIGKALEKHYRLVPPDEVTASDLATYRPGPFG